MTVHPTGVEIVDARAVVVPLSPVPPEQDAGGRPSAGSVDLFSAPGLEAGVWELTTGAVYDIEVDEVFVVVAGRATVDVLDDESVVTDRVDLHPGIACRLRTGTRTRWVVHETLRKVYVLRTEAE